MYIYIYTHIFRCSLEPLDSLELGLIRNNLNLLPCSPQRVTQPRHSTMGPKSSLKYLILHLSLTSTFLPRPARVPCSVAGGAPSSNAQVALPKSNRKRTCSRLLPSKGGFRGFHDGLGGLWVRISRGFGDVWGIYTRADS